MLIKVQNERTTDRRLLLSPFFPLLLFKACLPIPFPSTLKYPYPPQWWPYLTYPLPWLSPHQRPSGPFLTLPLNILLHRIPGASQTPSRCAPPCPFTTARRVRGTSGTSLKAKLPREDLKSEVVFCCRGRVSRPLRTYCRSRHINAGNWPLLREFQRAFNVIYTDYTLLEPRWQGGESIIGSMWSTWENFFWRNILQSIHIHVGIEPPRKCKQKQ